MRSFTSILIFVRPSLVESLWLCDFLENWCITRILKILFFRIVHHLDISSSTVARIGFNVVHILCFMLLTIFLRTEEEFFNRIILAYISIFPFIGVQTFPRFGHYGRVLSGTSGDCCEFAGCLGRQQQGVWFASSRLSWSTMAAEGAVAEDIERAVATESEREREQ